MQQITLPDELTMSLVDRVLACPEEERQSFLQKACEGDSELYSRAWEYIEWERRMGGFLLDPLCPPEPSDQVFEPGQLLINRFRIVREIARGGMGIVWEAIDERLDRRIAIKCAKAGFGKQLPPEVRNARKISHPNVCKLFEIHTASTPHGEVDFICMEYLEGETLSQRLRHGRLAKKECLSIGLQLCAGLAEAHREGVIHGDLKSNNVILSTAANGSLRAVIMDFGLARTHDAAKGNSSKYVIAGTPAYMAPELWKGVEPSVQSDIYALGVILWEMISGLSPSDLGVTSSTLSWDERPSWKPPRGYGKWDRALACCLQADPSKRYQSAEEVARALAPGRARVWLATAGMAALLAVISGLVTYQRATAPAETARLALLPFSSAPSTAALSTDLVRGTANQLAHLKSSTRTRISFVPEDQVIHKGVDTPQRAGALLRATYVLRGSIQPENDSIAVHAYLTNVRTGLNVKEWTAEYKPEEFHHVPTALAGVVTEALHLPLTRAAQVNAAARPDYLAGLSAIRREGGLDEALRHFERAVAADSDSALTYAGLAEAQWFKYIAHLERNWLSQFAESVKKAENRDPDLPEVHRVEGLLKVSSGWYDQAIAEYLRAIELGPANDDVYRRLGAAYENNNQLSEALTAYRKALETDPRQFRNHFYLGIFFLKRADYEAAIQFLQSAKQLAPGEPQIHRALGTALMDAGRFSASEGELRTSVRLREEPDTLHALGLVLMYQDRNRDAIPVIDRALSLGPNHHLWWMNLGTAYRRSGLARHSKRAYQQALDMAEIDMAENPRSGPVRSHLAYLCTQLGAGRRAASEIAQALEQSPNDANTRFMAVVTYEALRQRDETLNILRSSPAGVLADVSRWPDVADLRADPRFLKLLTARQER